MAKQRKLWPWILGGLAALGIGAGLVVASRPRGEGNIHRYMTKRAYDAADELPAESMIVVAAYNPAHPLGMNVDAITAELAAMNPTVHYVLVSRDIGLQQLDMDLDDYWGRVDAGHGDQVYSGGFTKDTTADDVRTHLQAATAAVKAGAYTPPDSTEDDEGDDDAQVASLARA